MSTLPYNSSTWGVLCLGLRNDVLQPKPACTSAACVVASFPTGFCYQTKIIEVVPSGAAWDAALVGDRGALQFLEAGRIRELERLGATYPNLWARIDSDAPPNDLSTFTIRVPWGQRLALPVPARRKIEIWVMWSCNLSSVTLPAIDAVQ